MLLKLYNLLKLVVTYVSVKVKKIKICQNGKTEEIAALKGDYNLTDRDKQDIISKINTGSADNIINRNTDVLPWVHAACKWGIHTDYNIEQNDCKRIGLLVTTDVHNHQEMFLNSIDYLNGIECLDAGVCLGDVAYHWYNEDATWYVNAVKSSEKPIYMAIGNHDIGYTDDGKKCGTVKMAYDKWIASTKNAVGLSSITTPYYSVKFDKYKIVLIVLNAFDVPDDKNSDGNYKVVRQTNSYSQAQINWLISTLKDIPSGYGVIIAQHKCAMDNVKESCSWSSAAGSFNGGSAAYKDLIQDVVNAWMTRSTMNTKYAPTMYTDILPTITANCDFSKRTDSIFICHLLGHLHHDIICHSAKYPKQKIVSLTSTCARRAPRQLSDLPRGEGSKTEDAITVLSVDLPTTPTGTGYIYLVRVGSNKTINMVDRTAIRIPFNV